MSNVSCLEWITCIAFAFYLYMEETTHSHSDKRLKWEGTKNTEILDEIEPFSGYYYFTSTQ